MKLNSKITLSVATITAIFFVSFLALFDIDKKSISNVNKERIAEFKTTFDSVVQLKGEKYKTILFDYSYWNDMAEYITDQNKTWAKVNLYEGMKDYKYDYTIIYNQNKEIIYNEKKDSNSPSIDKEIDLTSLSIKNIKFPNYFIKVDDKIIEIFSAPIQNEEDLTRTSEPKGYMLIGKIWTKEYLEHLNKIIKKNLVFVESKDTKNLNFVSPLKSYNNKTISNLAVNLEFRTVLLIENILAKRLLDIFLLSIFIVFFIGTLVYYIVVKPLNLITKFINNDLPENSLKKILNKKDELGAIAKAVYNSYEQKVILNAYKNAIDKSNMVYKMNSNGNITYVNDELCAISGYSSKELIGQSFKIIYDSDTEDELFEDIWETIKNKKEVWHGTFSNIKKDKSKFWVKTTVVPILNAQNKLIEYIVIKTDITEQELVKRHFEDEYNITSQKFTASFNRVKEYEKAINESTLVVRINLNGKLIYANDALLKISGYTKNEVIGKDYFALEEKDLKDKVYDVLLADKIWKGNISRVTKNNKEYFLSATILTIYDENHKALEFMAIMHDVTELNSLHKEIETTQREIIYKMGEIGETRSKETGNHVKRVAHYSKIFAKLYGLSSSDVDLLFTASPMHDIGKVGIPDAILNKPGKLTGEEFQVMKKHAQIGKQILSGSKRPVLEAAKIVAYEHHEKYDGSGYPRGIKEDEIHIFGRITAIADVFDALGSNRCYKDAWELDKILALFKKERAKHFDPQLVDIFFENLDMFLEIRDKYTD